MELEGKVAVVTGASRGIGKQVAIELGRRGASVVVAARTVEPRRRLPGTIGESVAAIEATGAKAVAVAADMGIEEDLDRLMSTTTEQFGRVDILVNNAADVGTRWWGASLEELDRAHWMAQYSVNLHAPYTLIRACLPIMRAQGGGRVINVTTGRHGGEGSVLGLNPPLAYPSSKAALDQLCVSVAPQLAAAGISITNVNPGVVRTELMDMMVEEGKDAGRSLPMDVPVRAIAYLATCDDPMAHTGKVLVAEEMVSQFRL